jgi:hypothetical protein
MQSPPASAIAERESRRILALCHRKLADLASRKGALVEAIPHARSAVDINQARADAAPTNLFTRGELAETLVATGAALAHQGHMAEARASTARGAQIARDLASRSTATPDELSRYASILLTCEPTELRSSDCTALRRAGRGKVRPARSAQPAYPCRGLPSERGCRACRRKPAARLEPGSVATTLGAVFPERGTRRGTRGVGGDAAGFMLDKLSYRSLVLDLTECV